MAGAGQVIEVLDIGVSEALDALLRHAGDLTPAMAAIGEHLLRVSDARWDREVDPTGAPWAPLKPATVARKRIEHPAAGILEETGMMRRRTYHADPDSVTFGGNRVQDATHQYGDPTRGIPARPNLGFEAGDPDIVAEILVDFLGGA
ncbi:MAG: phage virion morphogenesis protein [Gammaproteobacteria bacterium]|nr:phage virion morphogenesis protein [Gammaproteobacteria bacterium]